VISANDVDVLSRTIWGEARGEPYEGKVAVGRCIVTRWKSGKWFAGRTIAATAKKKYQFSCWLRSDPNRAKLLAVTTADPSFRECIRAAQDAIDGKGPEWLAGVTHYHAKTIKTPKWAIGKRPAGELAGHIFYAGID
jgi:N-acetylmuramoyl-L-alanine amidase